MSTDRWSSLLANDAIIAMAGHDAFNRGMGYARTGHVLHVHLDEESMAISGRVRGASSDAYACSVRLADPGNGRSSTHRGHCSCPVTQDCKHAAALLIAARAQAAISRHLERPAWEKSLERLVDAPDPPPRAPVVPLGLEFEVQEIPAYRGYPGRRELRVRPVQRGKSGKWVRSGISWDDLDHATLTHPGEQRDLLLQIRAATGPGARFVYPKSPWISLSTVTSGLWSLLEAAVDGDLALVGPGASDTVRRPPESAVVTLDLRRSDTGLVLEPRVTLDDATRLALTSVGLLGDPAHGVFSYARGHGSSPHRGLSLYQLAEPLGRELRQILVEAQPVTIPAPDEERFLTDFYPRMRRKAVFASSDESVVLPEPVLPVLTLRCEFKPEHRLRLDWGWAYGVGDGTRTFDLDEPTQPGTLRDLAAEAALLAGLALPYDQLPQLVDASRGRRAAVAGSAPAAHALLADLQAVYFCEQVLPGLEEAGVRITVVGERPDYRRVDTAPLVELSTVEADGSSDWFDLKIRVSLEGEVIPFDELFVALARGDEFLVLETGVYLSLERPEFVRLRSLIEEAQALQEPDSPGIRVSRFQASLWEEMLHLGVVVEQSARWAKAVGGLINVTSIDPVEVPHTLVAELRPYQVQGYQWLAFLWSHDLGGVLADDMGLGKTLQALALICRARMQEPGAPPFLVVAPTSVTSNWAREAARFAPGLRTVVVTESETKRGTPLADLVCDAD
ncbi:MAG TPA: SNF2-related protein, partial [Propionibacteriaceae bacterium]